MEIKISVILSADPALLAALSALSAQKASSLGGSQVTPVTATIEDKTKKEKPAPTKKEAPAADAIAGPAKDSPSTPVNGTFSSDDTHTLSSLRAIAVPLSKAGHKDAIKAWLKKAGYESIQNLEEKNFTGFYDFLQTLKA